MVLADGRPGGWRPSAKTAITVSVASRQWLSLFLFVLIAFFVSGCIVAPLKMQDITPSGSHLLHHHSQTVAVSSRVRQPCEVQTNILQNAIIDVINQTGLFVQATTRGRADYQLDVSLVSIQWPTTGFSMSSKVEMFWNLTRAQDGKSMFQDKIVSEYSENMFNTFLGEARSYAVMRGAIKENIQAGIDRLGKIDF